jgi:hypothetical protein
MASITGKSLVDGVALTNSIVTYYTVPANTVTKISEMAFSNNHTAAVTIDVYIVASGGSAANANHFFIGDATSGLVLASEETKVAGLDTIMTAGATIQMLASTTAVIGCRISGIEMVG